MASEHLGLLRLIQIANLDDQVANLEALTDETKDDLDPPW